MIPLDQIKEKDSCKKYLLKNNLLNSSDLNKLIKELDLIENERIKYLYFNPFVNKKYILEKIDILKNILEELL